MLLNEPNGQAQFVSASIVGLDANTQYLLTFDYWGDNGQAARGLSMWMPTAPF